MGRIEVPVEDVSLDAFDAFVSSGRAPEECMTLSDLDGFLTAVAIGPELIMPSEWLPVVWGGVGPSFEDENEAALVLGGIMSRYNEIVLNAADGVSDPIFWIGPEEIWIASDWAAGFLDGMMLRREAWETLFQSKKSAVWLFPILALCWNENCESLIGLTPEEEDQIAEEAAESIPDSIVEIADFWRRRRTGNAAAQAVPKAGRNAPCPCGSGKKFKRCCGANA